ncbi:MAG: hypothetical protein II622_00435 [Thermoguttaceae bacterium]|nr:hypothetical protein [Thermoguttaceae bacterium]
MFQNDSELGLYSRLSVIINLVGNLVDKLEEDELAEKMELIEAKLMKLRDDVGEWLFGSECEISE